nr:hypothetical protein [Clostridium estertheticum]
MISANVDDDDDDDDDDGSTSFICVIIVINTFSIPAATRAGTNGTIHLVQF